MAERTIVEEKGLSGLFWILLIIGVVFTVTGILLGNPFEDYQASSSL
ncbi:MAG: hypothetical protein HQL30_11770 [Candidatus Omnitrophica bacterium]|nr:hypothetical protein [Candidatus Omnitrophota bacterium]